MNLSLEDVLEVGDIPEAKAGEPLPINQAQNMHCLLGKRNRERRRDIPAVSSAGFNTAPSTQGAAATTALGNTDGAAVAKGAAPNSGAVTPYAGSNQPASSPGNEDRKLEGVFFVEFCMCFVAHVNQGKRCFSIDGTFAAPIRCYRPEQGYQKISFVPRFCINFRLTMAFQLGSIRLTFAFA